MIETLLDGREVVELEGADVPAEVSGENGVVEVNGGHIVELPSAHNEPAELDVMSQDPGVQTPPKNGDKPRQKRRQTHLDVELL